MSKEMKEKTQFVTEIIKRMTAGEFDSEVPYSHDVLIESFDCDFDAASEQFNIDEEELAIEVIKIYDIIKRI